MARKAFTTVTDVVKELNLSGDAEASTTFVSAGLKPEEIANHAISKEIIFMGVTPDNQLAESASATFDLARLQEQFAKICTDYGKPLIGSEPSKALEWAISMLYIVGPESCQIKKNSGDKTWVCRFPYSSNNKLVVKTAFVCTYKAENASYCFLFSNNNNNDNDYDNNNIL